MRKTRHTNCKLCNGLATLYVKKDNTTGECTRCRKGLTFQANQRANKQKIVDFNNSLNNGAGQLI